MVDIDVIRIYRETLPSLTKMKNYYFNKVYTGHLNRFQNDFDNFVLSDWL